MSSVADLCVPLWYKPNELDQRLFDVLPAIPGCRLIYAVDCSARQISGNITHAGADESARGQDLSVRPYIRSLEEGQSFLLSPVYVSQADHQPCLTAIQKVTDQEDEVIGCIAADFDLRDLSLSADSVSSVIDWRQIKGDPAIRKNLFLQEKISSPMDEHLDEVHDIVRDLLVYRGIFHAKLHYGSSRATLWLYRDPHRYRIHVLDEIIDPSVCLAYGREEYPEDAVISQDQVPAVLERFKALREADNTIYLRSASLNVVNGMVGLTFSCDGSHYMSVEAFLEKDDAFWFGLIPH